MSRSFFLVSLFCSVNSDRNPRVPPRRASTSKLSLSASCQSAATGLLSTNFATCANVVGLVQVVSASGSVITPLNNWLNGLCPKTCAQSDLSTAQNSINSGCASDISGGNPLALGLQALTANYTVSPRSFPDPGWPPADAKRWLIGKRR